jgi:hypothetical protein
MFGCEWFLVKNKNMNENEQGKDQDDFFVVVVK